jgi:hypothetical protein
VANTSNDSITIIDAATNRVEGEIDIRIPGLEAFRGVLPIGLAYHQRTGWLLAAEAGINAVAVIDVKQRSVLGHVPAAWFPTRVLLDGDTAFVTNSRGHGVGPDAPAGLPIRPESIANYLYQGTLSVFRVPADTDLPAQTAAVMDLNGLRRRPSLSARSIGHPDIRHVVLVVKENRSYDELLGDIPGAAGDPSLARFGTHGTVAGQGQRLNLRDVDLTPNHHAIARRWGFSDNFYSDAESSIDGHHWLVDSYPNAWTLSSLLAAMANAKDFRAVEGAPGRLSFPGMAASVHPEDWNQAGTLWHHLAHAGIPFANFGEGFELAGIAEGRGMEPTGARFSTNIPLAEPLYRDTSRAYPGFNLNISDQYRASRFIQDAEERWGKTGEELPQFVMIQLPNDYLGAPRPAEGYPYTQSYLADNDYALGRILEYLSSTRWWSRMVVFVTESSAQGGVDHIDAHRTLLLCAGPWCKKSYVSHKNASYPALIKTIFGILDLAPLNMFDAAAADLSDFFAPAADSAPYHALQADRRVFDPSQR